MSKNRIKEGDTVDVWYINESRIKDATVIRTPAGAGDLWQVEETDGTVRAINPYCLDFLEFLKHGPPRPIEE